MSSIGIVVILLSAIIKGSVGTKKDANNESAIADSRHKKEKSMTCHDVCCLRTNTVCQELRGLKCLNGYHKPQMVTVIRAKKITQVSFLKQTLFELALKLSKPNSSM
jgi:hypothetical protein